MISSNSHSFQIWFQKIFFLPNVSFPEAREREHFLFVNKDIVMYFWALCLPILLIWVSKKLLSVSFCFFFPYESRLYQVRSYEGKKMASKQFWNHYIVMAGTVILIGVSVFHVIPPVFVKDGGLSFRQRLLFIFMC